MVRGKLIIDEYTGRTDLSADQKFYLRNREHIKKEDHKRYIENREAKLAQNKAWRDNNPEKSRKSVEKSRTPERSLLYSAKDRANRFNLPFNLTLSDIQIPEFCVITGLRLKKGKNKIHDSSPSIDRMMPQLGYVKDNIRIISYKANRWKNNMSRQDVEKLLHYMTGQL